MFAADDNTPTWNTIIALAIGLIMTIVHKQYDSWQLRRDLRAAEKTAADERQKLTDDLAAAKAKLLEELASAKVKADLAIDLHKVQKP